MHDLARCRAETSVGVGCDYVANGICTDQTDETERDRARHDARAASECARAQTAHNHWSREAERPQFYGDRAGRDMFRARTRPDADSPTLRPINGRSTMPCDSINYTKYV